MYVSANLEMIRAQIASCETYIEDLKEEVRNIESIVSVMNSAWQGADYDQFKEKMVSFINEIKCFIDQLQSYKSYATGYVDTYELLENVYNDKNILLN